MVPHANSATWVTRVGDRTVSVHLRSTRIKVLKGADKGKSWSMQKERIRIGAQEVNDIPITDSRVSGIHCEIQLTKDGYLLRDLGSTNGTFVGELRLGEVLVPPKTKFRIGDSVLAFYPDSASTELALASDSEFYGLVGDSVPMRLLYTQLAKVAPTNATVLVHGETGVGKELVAAAIHDSSPRADKPFVVLDCSAIPANLMESELFGHEQGAFTGATSSYAGAFERADGGTLFLDEIGELPLSLQPKLLRVLESRQFRRLGAERVASADVRVVAATNRELAEEVNRGRFRSDLFYRLAVIELKVPSLRERLEDIPLLVSHFAAQLESVTNVGIGASDVAQLMQYHWPGNVRELRNTVERALLMSDRIELSVRTSTEAVGESNLSVDLAVPFKRAKKELIDEFEKRYATALLDEHDGNISAAARAAGIDRMSLHKIVQRHGIRK